MNEHSDRDKTEPPARDERQQRYAAAASGWGGWGGDYDTDGVLEEVMAVADAEQAELRAEVERWREKAQESGAAYANANSKHHEELDRANRLERLADTLAGKAVNLEDRARAAEAEAAKLADKVARVEALIGNWEGTVGTPESEAWARYVAERVRNALSGDYSSEALDGPTTAS